MVAEDILDVVYIGEDDRFFQTLSSELERIVSDPSKRILIEKSGVPDGQYPTTFKYLWTKKPKAIVLDFSSYADKDDKRYDYLIGLTRLLRQNEETKSIITIAVYDYLQKDIVVEQVLMAGVRFNYMKSSENDLIANDLLHVLNIEGFQAHELGIAEMDMSLSITQDLRIGYASEKYLRVETNVPLTLKSDLNLSKNPFQGVQGLCLTVEVADPRDGACYYPYKFPYHLRYKELGGAEFTSVELGEMNDSPVPKWGRVLVIDPDLEFIDNSMPIIDEIDFTLNIQSDFDSSLNYITHFKPHIVAFQNLSDEQQVKLRSASPEHMLLLSFKDNSGVQLSTTDSLTFGFIESALKKYTEAKKPTFGKEYFFHSKHPFAVAQLERDVKVVGFNESFIYFECEDELPIYCVFRMKFPFSGLITTVPNFSTDDKFSKSYVGLLNYNTEQSIQQIRREFNNFFAKEKMAKRQQEIEELKQVNKKFLKQRNKKNNKKGK